MRILLYLLLAIGCAANAAAQNTILVLGFGGDPGSPLPHSYSYGKAPSDAPSYRLRIASVDQQVKTVFPDTELTISAADKTVQQVAASRAYRSLTHCNTARAVVVKKLDEGLPREYAGPDGRWQRQSADGRVVGRVSCETPRHYPMPVLELLITLLPAA